MSKIKKELLSKEMCIEEMTENIQALESEAEEAKKKI